jgi:hypothetical protein
MALTQDELDEFDRQFAEDIKTVKDAGNGPYAQAIQDLLGLSAESLKVGNLKSVPAETYSNLIGLVEKASAMNLSQAQLKARIQSLGKTAVSIAKKVSSLATLF